MCVYCMTGTPEGSTESGFMEKPGIEPATPGLQGIALIHYTTEASLVSICGTTPFSVKHLNVKKFFFSINYSQWIQIYMTPILI